MSLLIKYMVYIGKYNLTTTLIKLTKLQTKNINHIVNVLYTKLILMLATIYQIQNLQIGNYQLFIMSRTFLKPVLLLSFLFQLTLQSGGHAGDIPGVGLSIAFIFGGLLLGGLLKVFSRLTHFPYNPLLVLVGLGLGYYHLSLGFLGKAAVLISELNPNGIIAIFLPALIFESAFKTQWHLFKKTLGQTLILGIPCAILGALFIMACLKIIAQQYGIIYTWTEAFLVGSILSCTDIFSFIQRLKKHGTPQKIISLIQGESLINYCICVLIFQIINQLVVMKNDNPSFLSLLQLFIEQTLGGILFGLFFAVVALFCLKRIIYDGILVVTIMVIFCYSIYLIAQFSSLRVSGIVAIVVYALYMNVFGKTIITGQVSSYVNTFWSYVVFVAQTSIFLIAGVNIGVQLIDFARIIFKDQIWIAVMIYFVCIFGRFFSITCFIKWLRNLGYGMNMKEAFVIAFTGLKGAIGISLAMLVYKNPSYAQNIRHLTLFVVAGNSILSLSLNGGFAGFVVKALGISTLTKTEYKFYKEFLFTIEKNVLQKKNELKAQKYLDMVNWQELDMMIGLPNYKKIRDQTEKIITKSWVSDGKKFQKRQMYKLEEALKSFARRDGSLQLSAERQISDQNVKFDLVVELRKRFIKASIAKYWEYHDESYISPGALLLLIQSAYFDLDTEAEELESWTWIKSQISYNIKFLSELMKISLLNKMARSYLFEYISYCYDIVSSYIEASEAVRTQFRQFTLVNHQKDILEMIMTESEQNQKEAESFMRNYLQPSFPQIEKEVVTRKASYHVISYFKHIIERFYETGQLDPIEYDMLKNIVEQRSLELDLSSPKWQKTNFLEMLKTDLVFGLLPQAILKVLADDLSEERTYDVNEKILQHGQIAKHVFFITKGGCEIEFVNENAIYKESHNQGEMYGFESIISQTYHSTTTANTMVTAMAIKKSCIQKIMDIFPRFEEAFWKKNMFEFYKMFLNKNDLTFHLSHLKRKVIDDLLENFQLQEFLPGVYETPKDMIFLRGNIVIIEDEQESDPHHLMFISKNDNLKFEVKSKSMFLVGEVDYDVIEKANRFYSNYMSNTTRLRRKETLQNSS